MKLCSVILERFVSVPNVKRIPVRQGNIRGTLFLPPGDGPFPSVLDIWGGMGGLTEFRAGKKFYK